MKDKDKTKNVISRRDFMKRLGLATAAVTGLSSITSCKKEGQAPAGEMTYRTNPTTGDKVSLLGFGMMRLPSQAGGSAREGGAIDQEIEQIQRVHRSVDDVGFAFAYAVETAVEHLVGESRIGSGCNSGGADLQVEHIAWQFYPLVVLVITQSAQGYVAHALCLCDAHQPSPLVGRHGFEGVKLVEGTRPEQFEEVAFDDVHQLYFFGYLNKMQSRAATPIVIG